MKMNIAGYELDIKAKRFEDRANKQDLIYFLNFISIMAGEARDKYMAEDLPGLSAEAGRWVRDIDSQLHAMGALESLI